MMAHVTTGGDTMEPSPTSLGVYVPPPVLTSGEVQAIIGRLTLCQVEFLLWLPSGGRLVTTAGPMMRVLIRLMWLRGLCLVEVRGPVGDGETVRLTRPGISVAIALRQMQRKHIPSEENGGAA
jgi:hypothetical protein